ncbi:unnamed protein product [marine sediment metagenome]|uniref:Uncharacterized protein n=1 Tax=marine sediment metagenome TaxID=412755 RepID=X1DZV3_9ZZZZ
MRQVDNTIKDKVYSSSVFLIIQAIDLPQISVGASQDDCPRQVHCHIKGRAEQVVFIIPFMEKAVN